MVKKLWYIILWNCMKLLKRTGTYTTWRATSDKLSDKSMVQNVCVYKCIDNFRMMLKKLAMIVASGEGEQYD